MPSTPTRSAARDTVRTRPGCRSAATTRPVAAHPLRRRGRLAPGRARRCRARGRRAADRGPRRSPGSPGPAASPGRRRSRARAARSPVWRTNSAPGTSVPGCDLGARGDELGGAAPRSWSRDGLTRKRHRRRLVVELEGGDRGRRAERRRRTQRTIQSGCEVRTAIDSTSSPAGSRNGGPLRASARSTPFAKPRRPLVDDTDGLADRRVRGHTDEQLVRAEAQRGAHRRVERADAAVRHRRRAATSSARCMRTVPYTRSVTERAVASREVRAAQGAGQEDVRVRAVLDPQAARRPRSGATSRSGRSAWASLDAESHAGRERVDSGIRASRDRHAARRAWRACLRAAPRRARARRRPCAESTVGADRRRPRAVRRGHLGAGFVRAPHLHPPAADPEPRARARVAGPHDAGQLGRGPVRVEPELVDAELVGIRRLADLRLGRRVGDRRQVRAQQLGARVDQTLRAAPRPSRRARSGRATRANTGPVSRPASICMRSTPVSASPARIARSTGAAPRQRGSNEKCRFTKPCGNASSNATGSSCPNATTTPSSAPARTRPRRRPRAPSPA